MMIAKGLLERSGVQPQALLAGASMVVLSVVVAVVLLRPADHGPTKPSPATAGNKVFRVVVPPEWSRERQGLQFASLPLSNAVGLQHRLLHVRFVAGVLPASSPTLLPARLLAGVSGPLPRSQKVVIGGVEAYYYPSLRHEDAPGPMDVFVVPTTEGVLTMSCISTPAAVTALSECDDIAESVRLLKGRPLRVGPHAAFAERLPSTLEALEAARRDARASLGSRPNRADDVAGIEALADQYGAAARELAPLMGVRPAWRRTVVDLLEALSRSYRRAAALLEAGEPAGFRTAARTALDQLRELQRVLGIPRREK
jgi:hypothetical protein